MATTHFGLFVDGVLVATATQAAALKSQFCVEMRTWKLEGEIGKAPVIKRTGDTVRPAVYHLSVSGNTAAQVEAIVTALATHSEQVIISTTSDHIYKWALGQWKAKSAGAQALVAAVAAHGNVVVAKPLGDKPLLDVPAIIAEAAQVLHDATPPW